MWHCVVMDKNTGLLGEELTLFQATILDFSKLKEFANDNFEFDENGKKLSRQVRAISPFPTVFSKGL